jgi:hypothetical protein
VASKGLAKGAFVCVAGKGVRKVASDERSVTAFCEVPPTRVFWKKRLDLLDSKGVDFFGDDKEAAS